MIKKIKYFIKLPFKTKKTFFVCLYLATLFLLLKRMKPISKLLHFSKKPLIISKPSFSEKNLIEMLAMINKVSNNLIKISCLLKVLILKKYFADSEVLEINIGIRSFNDSFESHAWINHELFLKLENDEFMTFKKLYAYS